MNNFKKNNEIVIHSITSPLPSYGWYKHGNDFILNMGEIKKAVVIQELAFYQGYSIAIASYFPFPQSYYDKRFKDYMEAIKTSSEYIARWMEESIKYLDL